MTQEGGCTLEDLLVEDEHTVNQCRAANPKLIEFMCQKETLQKLIGYATRYPQNPNNQDQSYKFPFVAADVLTASATIAQAITEGGWKVKEPEEESDDEKKGDLSGDEFDNDNKLF